VRVFTPTMGVVVYLHVSVLLQPLGSEKIYNYTCSLAIYSKPLSAAVQKADGYHILGFAADLYNYCSLSNYCNYNIVMWCFFNRK
jgi:hypothetical protein